MPERFVQKEDFRFLCQYPCQGNPLLLATTQKLDLCFCKGFHFDEVEEFINAFLMGFAFKNRKELTYVFFHGNEGHQIKILRQVFHIGFPGNQIEIGAKCFRISPKYGAFLYMKETVDNFEQGAFSRAAFAHQGHMLPRGHFKSDIL